MYSFTVYEARILSEAQSLVQAFSAARHDLSHILSKCKRFVTFFIKYFFFYDDLVSYEFFQLKISGVDVRSYDCNKIDIKEKKKNPKGQP